MCMEEPITYRGRRVTAEDLGFLRELIWTHPQASRRKLSALVCEAWDWRQANGVLRDMVCRGMMLMLHRAGHIELPAKKQSPANPLATRRKPATDILVDESQVCGPLRKLQALEIQQVRRSALESLFNILIERDHYLGYIQPVGEHLKHMVLRVSGRWPAWAGVRLRGTWGRETGSSVGVPPLDRTICIFWPTTPAS